MSKIEETEDSLKFMKKEEAENLLELTKIETSLKLTKTFFNQRFSAIKKSNGQNFQVKTTFEWVQKHSENVATAAAKLATYVGLDPNEIFVAALLHDIGKTNPNCKGLDHGRRGRDIILKFRTDLLNAENPAIKNLETENSKIKNSALKNPETKDPNEDLIEWLDTAARVAMTHTWYAFDDVDRADYFQPMDKNEVEAVKNFIREVPIDDNDRLIQLLDNMVGAVGVMTISDRFCDILVRHEPADASGHLKALYALKQYFDAKAGFNIYELFRKEIIKNALKEPNELAGVESASDFSGPK